MSQKRNLNKATAKPVNSMKLTQFFNKKQKTNSENEIGRLIVDIVFFFWRNNIIANGGSS